MKRFLPVPYPEKNNELSFYQTDSAELFEANKKKYGKAWVWHDKDIVYKFNSNSYRMNTEVEDIDSPYCLFFGCSFTVGHGVDLESSWPWLVASELNMEYINAGVGGCSPEYVVDNLEYFLSGVRDQEYSAPEFIVINWPSLLRRYWTDDTGATVFKIPEINRNDQWHDEYKDFLMDDEKIISYFRQCRSRAKSLCEQLSIPLWEFTQALPYQTYRHELNVADCNVDWTIQPTITDCNLPMIVYNGPMPSGVWPPMQEVLNKYQARDVSPTGASHHGISVHRAIAKNIISWWNNKT